MSEKMDVVIISGGPGGTSAAMHLASKGKRVFLVENRENWAGPVCLMNMLMGN